MIRQRRRWRKHSRPYSSFRNHLNLFTQSNLHNGEISQTLSIPGPDLALANPRCPFLNQQLLASYLGQPLFSFFRRADCGNQRERAKISPLFLRRKTQGQTAHAGEFLGSDAPLKHLHSPSPHRTIFPSCYRKLNVFGRIFNPSKKPLGKDANLISSIDLQLCND